MVILEMRHWRAKLPTYLVESCVEIPCRNLDTGPSGIELQVSTASGFLFLPLLTGSFILASQDDPHIMIRRRPVFPPCLSKHCAHEYPI